MYRFRLLGAPAVLGTPHPQDAPHPQDVPHAQGGRMPPQQTAVLAALALRAGLPVGVVELIDGLFGERPPASATSMVANYVLRLRKSLTPALIVRSGDGYLLDVPASSVDALSFVELVSARPTGDERRDAERLRTALDLWHGGSALAGLPGPLCHRQRESLAQHRDSAQASWFEYELALGRHSMLLGELSAACQAAPFAERLHAARMTALFRCGRPADALQAYQQIRRQLAVELGIDPGDRLTRVHEAILSGRDPAPARSTVRLTGVRSDEAGATGGRPVPRQLPAPAADLTGRKAEVAAVSAALTGHRRPLVLVTGMTGVGKSTVAVAAAHEVAANFPDGQLWAALGGMARTPAGASAVLAGFLSALGVPDQRIPPGAAARAALYRTELAGRRVLVVLDDADGPDAADRIAPLLPGTPGSAVLVCARARPALGVTAWTQLARLPATDSAELVTRIIGPARAGAEPAAVAALAAACGRLPLALHSAATRLTRRPAWTVASLAARLSDGAGLLRELRGTDPRIDSAFERSFEALDPAQADALMTLAGSGSGRWALPEAAAVLGLPEGRAEQLLEALVEAAVLGSPTPGDYTLQELLAAFARDRAGGYTSVAASVMPASASYAAWRCSGRPA